MNDDLHTLSGAYAVDALPYAEWVLFDKHLRGCQGCGAEVRRLRETAARLAETVAEPPPAVLRERLLAVAQGSRRHGDRPQHVPPFTPAPAVPLGPASPPVPAAGGGQVVPLRRRRSKVLAGLAAVSVAAAIALGAVAFDARRDLGDLTVRNEELAAVLAAPDAQTVREPVTSGGTGTIVISRSKGRMVFISSGLRALPESRTYELWLMGPDGPRPAGLLARAEGGVTAPMLLTPLEEDDKVAITVESARGSAKPTTQPIMLAELPAA